MNKSKNIDLANPFIGFDSITESICDIKNICTKIVHMSDNGIVVSLPNNDTLLLSNIPTDNYQVGDFINIYIDNEGCFCLDDGLFEINKKVLIKAKENQPFIGEIIEAEASWTRKGLMKTITTTTGPIKIEVEAEAKKTYILKYDTEENNFIFEEFIGEEEK